MPPLCWLPCSSCHRGLATKQAHMACHQQAGVQSRAACHCMHCLAIKKVAHRMLRAYTPVTCLHHMNSMHSVPCNSPRTLMHFAWSMVSSSDGLLVMTVVSHSSGHQARADRTPQNRLGTKRTLQPHLSKKTYVCYYILWLCRAHRLHFPYVPALHT